MRNGMHDQVICNHIEHFTHIASSAMTRCNSKTSRMEPCMLVLCAGMTKPDIDAKVLLLLWLVRRVCEGSDAMHTRKLDPKLVKVANAAAWPLHAVKTQSVTQAK